MDVSQFEKYLEKDTCERIKKLSKSNVRKNFLVLSKDFKETTETLVANLNATHLVLKDCDQFYHPTTGVLTNFLKENHKEGFLVVSSVKLEEKYYDSINAETMENLNSVLDDNFTLCLANGERVKRHENMTMIFVKEKCCDLTPATISRFHVY